MCFSFGVFACSAGTARAQASAVVLVLPASTRAAGGGDAAPFATDASALFYGGQRLPAARSVTASGGTWIGDASLAAVAFSTPVPFQRWAHSIVSVGVRALDYGSAEEIVPDPLTGGLRGTATGGKVSGNEMAVAAGLHQTFRSTRVGYAVNYVRQTVADLSASALTMSIATGLTLRRWDIDLSSEHMSLGARNPARRTLTLPSTARLSITSPTLALGGSEWRGIGEQRRTVGEGTTSLLGVEGTYATDAGWRLLVRGAGLTYSDQSARAPWSVGGSAERGPWSFDYAYQGFGALGAVHRLGITWHSRDQHDPSR